jgi:hypothetical protein
MSRYSDGIGEQSHPPVGYPNRRQGLLGSIDFVTLDRSEGAHVDQRWLPKYLTSLAVMENPGLIDELAATRQQFETGEQ